MTASILVGAVVGLMSGLISEALLKYWAKRPEIPALKISMTGSALRALWVLAALIVVWESGFLEPRGFTAGLVAAYLAAQIWEGFRYKRFLDQR